ncbi:MAG: sodium:solute symporter [Alistipes sp.]|nr:sodium:solute symporter [Alistipes sp.]
MSPFIIILTIIAYLLVVFCVAYRSGQRSDNAAFFTGNRTTSWYMATLAMIGAAMSGVTFISVPGSVAADSMTYMQMVAGFTVGQLVVAFLLVPMFYRLGIVSLYEYLDRRFGITTHRAGAGCFLAAKIISASLKIYVVCVVMQLLVFNTFGIPFWITALLTMFFVWLYTRKGGVKVLIPTDAIQSVCLVGSVVVCVISLARSMNLDSVGELYDAVATSPYSQMWQFDNAASPRYFWKMFFGGVLCLVAMTGLDQDMMQRNMSCRTVRDSQINIVLTALCQIGVILLLLVLGVLLYRYVEFAGLRMPMRGDDIFPYVAVQGGLPKAVGVMFVLGLISSTYSAAGSALTSLTTSFTIDILGSSRNDESAVSRRRQRVHAAMAVVVAALVVVLNYLCNDSVINVVFKIAGYTYGPILGLFLFGMVTQRKVRECFVPFVIILSPLLSGLLQWFVATHYNYHIGFELLGYNALLTVIGLWIISRREVVAINKIE